MSAGNLVGIGAQMKPDGDQLLVLTPLPDSPALRAGLLPRDAIIAIDGKPVKELGFAGAIEAIRGPAGSVVRLQILRAEKPEELTIVRAQVPIRSVKGLVLDATGRPISDALVRFVLPSDLLVPFGTTSLPLESESYQAWTDDDGRFRIAPVPAVERALVEASHHGYETESAPAKKDAGEIEIVLPASPR